MSNKICDLTIWMPLRPGSSWRGEGIAQTVENILSNLSSNINCTLVVSKTHAAELDAILEKCPNIRLACVGFKSKQHAEIDTDSVPKSSFFQLVSSKIKFNLLKKFSSYFNSLCYIATMYFYTELQRFGFFLPKSQIIWVPTPIIPFIGNLRGNKIFSFWDPFVFEYRDFSDISNILYKHYRNVYSRANAIITQSQANRSFLTDVFNMNEIKIHVINNGSPDFSSFLKEFEPIGKRNPKSVVDLWGRKTFKGKNKQDAYNKLIADSINKTILWRLGQKFDSKKDRIIMVSTQCRPYKGFGVLFEVLDKLVKSEKLFRYQIIMTSSVPSKIKDKYPLLYERIHEVIRVTNKQLAALYYMSDLVLHPSYVEGGVGVYPQFEAASVGTPCLVNIGRHVLEHDSCDEPPQFTTTNFVDVPLTIGKIEKIMLSDDEKNMNVIESKKLAISWQDAAKKYDDVFLSMA